MNFGSPTPVVTGVSPASGPTSGDTPVTVSGQNLFAASEVSFGSKQTSDFYIADNGDLVVASPPGAAGLVNID